MTTFEYTLTTGIFGIVVGAYAVDWTLLNDSDVEQEYRVTAYNCPIYSPKRVVPPGPIEGAILPSVPSYYAYGIGDPNPFGGVPALDGPGFPVEVVVEVNDPRVLPTVEMWSSGTSEVIAGTRIGPGQFVRLS